MSGTPPKPVSAAPVCRNRSVALEKTLENFDLKRLPQKAARQMKTLQDGTFLDRKENVLAFGNPGSGKTHIFCRRSDGRN